jgi:hypothetical protein
LNLERLNNMSYTKESEGWSDIANEGYNYIANIRTLRRRASAIGDDMLALAGPYDSPAGRMSALEALANAAPFGLNAGLVTIAPSQPTNNHVKLEYPGGTVFSKTNNSDLYSQVASVLTNWNSVASGTNVDLNGVVHNDGRTIAAGALKGIYSTDSGANWNSASVDPIKTVIAVAANGLTGASAVIVGVGNADYVGTTAGATAGDNWSTQTSIIADTAYNYREVKWFAGTVNKFVAIAYKEDPTDVFTTKIVSSADGVTWALEKTLAGRYESVAYNNNHASTNEFVIVGWPGLGDTECARKSTALSGTWTSVTFGGTKTALLNSVEYYDDATGRVFAVCGYNGVAGSKGNGVSDFTAATPVVGTPILNKVVADSTNDVFYALGDLTGGQAYIYEADVSTASVQWILDSVGGFSLNDYAEDGAGERIIVGNGGVIFTYGAAGTDDFTMPYPFTDSVPSPYFPWILTQGFAVTDPGGGSSEITTGDLSKLETGWVFVRIKETFVKEYFRCFAINDSGTIVAGGDNGMLYKSTDFGSSWSDIGTALGITGDIVVLEFNSQGHLFVGRGQQFYIVDATLTSVLQSILTGVSVPWVGITVSSNDDFLTISDFEGDGGSYSIHAKGFADWNGATYTLYNNYNMQSTGFEVHTSQPRTRILNIGSDYFWSVVLADGVSSNIATPAANPMTPSNSSYIKAIADISNFKIKDINYTEAWNETLLVGAEGKAYRIAGIPGQGTPTALTTEFDFDIEDVTFGAGAWVMCSRRGILVSTDSQTTTNYSGVVTGTRLLYIPGQLRFLCNDLAEPGYIKYCQL